MIQKYFSEEIILYKEIKGHFNKNYKVKTKSGVFHLKIFKNKKFEIKEWLEGSTIKIWDEKTIKLVCQEIFKLHQEKKDWLKMNYHQNNIRNQKYDLLLKKYENDQLVACHNDLNKDNIIINENEAFLIDFEFKRLNNKYWEIANIINEDNLNINQINLFLKHYKNLNKEKLIDFIYINKIFVNWWKSKFL